MEHPDSPRPRQRRQIGLQQEQDDEAVVLAAGGNQQTIMTIYHLNEDLLRLSHALLGIGHFRYGPLACKMFLRASKLNKHFKKITTGKSFTCSVSCAKKYFENECTG